MNRVVTLCEGETLGGEISLIFYFILSHSFNKTVHSFQFNSGFLTNDYKVKRVSYLAEVVASVVVNRYVLG